MIDTAKLQKIPETAKNFLKFFQRKSAQKGFFFCMAASSDPTYPPLTQGRNWALGFPS
jgi:hypothetical protein